MIFSRNSTLLIFFKKIILIISFMLLTIGSSVGVSGKVKYIAIFFLLAVLLIQSHISNKRLRFEDSCLLVVVTVVILFQTTSLIQKVYSLAFFCILIFFSNYGELIVSNKVDLLMISTGELIGIIVSFLLAYINDEPMIVASRNRLTGGFQHPNFFGMYLLLSIWIFIYLYFSTIDDRFFLEIALINAIMLYFTKSRTAIILLVLFIFSIILNKYKKRIECKSFFAFLFILFVASIVYFVGYKKNDISFLGRLDIFYKMKVNMRTFFVGNGMVPSSELNLSMANGGHLEIGWVLLFYKSGVLGCLIYFYLVYRNIIKIIRIQNSRARWFGITIMCLFLFSGFSEAYIINILNVFSIGTLLLLSYVENCEENDIAILDSKWLFQIKEVFKLYIDFLLVFFVFCWMSLYKKEQILINEYIGNVKNPIVILTDYDDEILENSRYSLLESKIKEKYPIYSVTIRNIYAVNLIEKNNLIPKRIFILDIGNGEEKDLDEILSQTEKYLEFKISELYKLIIIYNDKIVSDRMNQLDTTLFVSKNQITENKENDFDLFSDNMIELLEQIEDFNNLHNMKNLYYQRWK